MYIYVYIYIYTNNHICIYIYESFHVKSPSKKHHVFQILLFLVNHKYLMRKHSVPNFTSLATFVIEIFISEVSNVFKTCNFI